MSEPTTRTETCEFRVSICLTHPRGQIMSDGKGGYRPVCTVIEPPPDLTLTRSVPVNDYERLLRIEAAARKCATTPGFDTFTPAADGAWSALLAELDMP